MTEWSIEKIPSGSLHLRLVKKSDIDEPYPEYSQHVILKPLGNGQAELSGMVGKVSKSVYQKAFGVAKSVGYKEVIIRRVQKDRTLLNKVYKL
jgi:hypothetical protein